MSGSATRSKCRPVSATSSTATGTDQGGGAGFWDLGSGTDKVLRRGKSDDAAHQRVIIQVIEQRQSHAPIGRKRSRAFLVARRKDIALQGRLKGLPIEALQSVDIGGLPAVKGLGERLHFLRHRQVAGAHFP